MSGPSYIYGLREHYHEQIVTQMLVCLFVWVIPGKATRKLGLLARDLVRGKEGDQQKNTESTLRMEEEEPSNSEKRTHPQRTAEKIGGRPGQGRPPTVRWPMLFLQATPQIIARLGEMRQVLMRRTALSNIEKQASSCPYPSQSWSSQHLHAPADRLVEQSDTVVVGLSVVNVT